MASAPGLVDLLRQRGSHRTQSDQLQYLGPGRTQPRPLHRAIRNSGADLAAGTVRYHVDGQLVFTGNAARDGRHSLYSNVDPGPDLLLLNEGDTSAVRTHELCLSSFFCVDRPLTVQELQSLAGPIAEGISVGLRPIQLSIAREAQEVPLTWTGGGGYFQLQQSATEPPWDWTDVDLPTTSTSALLEASRTASFYRILAR
jgi:hypothetical protein